MSSSFFSNSVGSFQVKLMGSAAQELEVKMDLARFLFLGRHVNYFDKIKSIVGAV